METTDLAKNEEENRELTTFQKGNMTAEGLFCEDGSFIPRAKKEPRPNLTEEDEIIISRWTNDYAKDYPNVDIGLVHMFCTWAFRHPVECEQYVKDQKNKLLNMTAEQRVEFSKRNPFEDLEKEFERMK